MWLKKESEYIGDNYREGTTVLITWDYINVLIKRCDYTGVIIQEDNCILISLDIARSWIKGFTKHLTFAIKLLVKLL